MQYFSRFFFVLLFFLSACSSGENEINKSEKPKQEFKSRTIYLDHKENVNTYTGTFKFDFSYEATELYYFVTFEQELSNAKVKIISKSYVLDQENNEYEDPSYKEFKLSDDYIGRIKVLKDDKSQIKCKLTLTEYHSFLIYFDKKINNWYIDVESTDFSEFKSQKKLFGNRIK